MNKPIKEKSLPPLLSINDDCYFDENGELKCEEFSIKELGERLEQELLELPDFQPPHTTKDNPVRILDYHVFPECQDEERVVWVTLTFLPGNKAEEYYKKRMDKTVFNISTEQDVCFLGDWLRSFIHENQQMPKRTLYTTDMEKLPPVAFNVEVKITRQASNGTSVQR